MLHRRQLRELTAVGQYFRDESLAFGNPLDLDRDALHRAFDPLETFGDVGGNRGRRRAAALDAPRPGARERKEHQAQHAEYDRYDEEVLSHGEFSRDDPGRGSAPAGCSPRSASSLVRKRWFSILRAHAPGRERVLLHESESEPRTARLVRHVRLENRVESFRRDADARVANRDHDLAPGTGTPGRHVRRDLAMRTARLDRV